MILRLDIRASIILRTHQGEKGYNINSLKIDVSISFCKAGRAELIRIGHCEEIREKIYMREAICLILV